MHILLLTPINFIFFTNALLDNKNILSVEWQQKQECINKFQSKFINEFNRMTAEVRISYPNCVIFSICNQLLEMMFRNALWAIFHLFLYSGIFSKTQSPDMPFVLPPRIIYASKYCFLSFF